MFKRLVLAVLVSASAVLAQVTATITSFQVSPKVVVARNLSGTPLKSVYCAGNPDSLQPVVVIGTVVDTFYSQFYRAVVNFNVSLEDRTSKATTYTDTLRHGVQHRLPAAAYSGIRDSVLYIELEDTTIVKPGDMFEASIRRAPWRVSTYLDSLQIFWSADSVNTY